MENATFILFEADSDVNGGKIVIFVPPDLLDKQVDRKKKLKFTSNKKSSDLVK